MLHLNFAMTSGCPSSSFTGKSSRIEWVFNETWGSIVGFVMCKNHNQIYRLFLWGHWLGSSLTLFSVSVHRHQWRKWIWENRKHPSHCSASDFLGKGKSQPNSGSRFEAPAEPTACFIAVGSTIVLFFFFNQESHKNIPSLLCCLLIARLLRCQHVVLTSRREKNKTNTELLHCGQINYFVCFPCNRNIELFSGRSE